MSEVGNFMRRFTSRSLIVDVTDTLRVAEKRAKSSGLRVFVRNARISLISHIGNGTIFYAIISYLD